MNIISLSPSSMDAFGGCHNKFFIEQILKYRSGNIKAGLKGTILHEVNEVLAHVRWSQLNGEIFGDDGDGCSTDGRFGIDLTLPISIRTVEELTSLTFEYYKASEPFHNWKPEDKKDCIEWAKRVYKSPYNPLNLDILEVERFFEIELVEPEFCYSYGEGVEGFLKLRGVIDLIIKHDETTVEILDWKSGQRKDFHTQKVKEIDDLYDDTQLLVYLYAVKTLLKYPNIIVTIFYLREGPITLNFQEKHIKRAKEKILEKFEAIKAKNRADRDISWKCGKLCDFNKRTFEGTHVKPFVEFRDGEFTKAGETMSICQQVHYCNEQKGLEWTSKYLKKK